MNFIETRGIRSFKFRSLRNESIEVGNLNLFIGSNAAGKSTLLDALRFLHEAVKLRDFRTPVHSRGGFHNLCWKGEYAESASLSVKLVGSENERSYEWQVCIRGASNEFFVEESVIEVNEGRPPVQLLESKNGKGWWWSSDRRETEALKQGGTMCALAAASANASFTAREIVDFIENWGIFDPNPFLLRRDWAGMNSDKFDAFGRNLAATLHEIRETSPDGFNLIMGSTEDILGLTLKIETRVAEDRFYFVQHEPGLEHTVHQMGVSSGTLRVLALMTAIHETPDVKLIGIEEPENYVHPSALAAFTEFIQSYCDRVQFLITTHSPLLLDYFGDPSAVRIVSRSHDGATSVSKRSDGKYVQRALDESGFTLGEFYETKGFGST